MANDKSSFGASLAWLGSLAWSVGFFFLGTQARTEDILCEINRAEDVTQSVEYLLSMHEVLGLTPTLNRPGLVVKACSRSTWRQKQEGSRSLSSRNTLGCL